jgi:hypothetical protein
MNKGFCTFTFLPTACISCLIACDEDNGFSSGESRRDYCSDGTINTRACGEDETGGNPCGCTTYSVWCDDDTDLCWQDPQKDAYATGNGGVTSSATGSKI